MDASHYSSNQGLKLRILDGGYKKRVALLSANAMGTVASFIRLTSVSRKLLTHIHIDMLLSWDEKTLPYSEHVCAKILLI